MRANLAVKKKSGLNIYIYICGRYESMLSGGSGLEIDFLSIFNTCQATSPFRIEN